MSPQDLIRGPTSAHERGEQIRAQQPTAVRLRRIAADPPTWFPGDQKTRRRVKTLHGASEAVGLR